MKIIIKTFADIKWLMIPTIAGTFLGMVWTGEFLNSIFLILPIGFLLLNFLVFLIRNFITDKLKKNRK